MSTLPAGHYKLVHMAQMFYPAKEIETTLKAMLDKTWEQYAKGKASFEGKLHSVLLLICTINRTEPIYFVYLVQTCLPNVT